MPVAARKTRPATRDAELYELAQRLRDALPRVPSGYKPGRLALVRALEKLTGGSPRAASHTLKQLIELGTIRYSTEGRGIGVAGVWTYPRTQSTRPRTPMRARRAG